MSKHSSFNTRSDAEEETPLIGSSVNRLTSPGPSSSVSQAGGRARSGSKQQKSKSADDDFKSDTSLRKHLQNEDTYRNFIDDLPLPSSVHKLRHVVLKSAVDYLEHKLKGSESRENLKALAKEGLEAEMRSLEKAVERRQSKRRPSRRLSKGVSRKLSPLMEEVPNEPDDQFMSGAAKNTRNEEERESKAWSGSKGGSRSSSKRPTKPIRRSSSMSTSDAGMMSRLTGIGLTTDRLSRKSSSKKSVAPASPEKKHADGRSESKDTDHAKRAKYIDGRKVSSRDAGKLRRASEPVPIKPADSRSKNKHQEPRFSFAKGLKHYVQEVVAWELQRQVDRHDGEKEDRLLSRASSRAAEDMQSAELSGDPMGTDGKKRHRSHTRYEDHNSGAEDLERNVSHVPHPLSRVSEREEEDEVADHIDDDGIVHSYVSTSPISTMSESEVLTKQSLRSNRSHASASSKSHLSQMSHREGPDATDSRETTKDTHRPSTGLATLASRDVPSSRVSLSSRQSKHSSTDSSM